MKLENLIVQIGELIYTEINEVETIEYDKKKDNILTIVLSSSEKFIIKITK